VLRLFFRKMVNYKKLCSAYKQVIGNAMKTIELREYYRILSELNNSFTHYSFVWEQFSIDYDKILIKRPNSLTKDYFENNPYKRKHNIKLCDLETEHNKTHNTLIKGIFLLIYTHFEGYLKELLIFSNKVDRSIKLLENKLESDEDDALLLDKVLKRIGISKDSFNNIIPPTLDYIRLKRNRLIHSNVENISKSLTAIIKNQGFEINNYWNNALPRNLQGLDFSDKENANQLTFNIIIDTINIFRAISLDIDNAVINKLTIARITEKIIIPAFKDKLGKTINGFKIERLENKFKRFSNSEFAFTVSNDIMDLFKRSIV
jgi:hypothetical protein